MTILAYVDPGSGMLAWQLVVAGFVGLVFYLKKVRSLFGKLGRRILGKE
ncbi:MAG TPA: hypothetical protein VFT34_19075 [Verrucomicrobiae bacterium]|nr:hypothetical protein [Verrucomicrobiae bacterium]